MLASNWLRLNLTLLLRYFEMILASTDEDVEEVEVEPDGEWHTSDNKYASAGWLAAVRAKSESANKDIKPVVTPKPNPDANKSISNISAATLNVAPQNDGEIYVLDSDSDRDEEGQVKREISPGHRRTSNGIARNGADSSAPSRPHALTPVIDLTLDSDPEDIPPRPPYQAGKRKADEALMDRGADGTKRAREGSSMTIRRDSASRYSVAPPTSAGSGNGSHASPFNNTRTLPPPIPTRQTSSSSLSGSFHTHLSMGSSSPRYTSGGGDRSPLNGYQRSVHTGPFASVNGDSRTLPPPNPNGFGYSHEVFPRLNGGASGGGSSSPGGWPR